MYRYMLSLHHFEKIRQQQVATILRAVVHDKHVHSVLPYARMDGQRLDTRYFLKHFAQSKEVFSSYLLLTLERTETFQQQRSLVLGCATVPSKRDVTLPVTAEAWAADIVH